jgi:hypothetical protein
MMGVLDLGKNRRDVVSLVTVQAVLAWQAVLLAVLFREGDALQRRSTFSSVTSGAMSRGPG